MKKAMETIGDLIEEAKIRTVWWALCIFAISYFLSNTSKSMWTNIPIAILVLSFLRVLSYEVEFRWKAPQLRKPSYLSYLEKKKLAVDDPRLVSEPPSMKWKRKIDSPLVEAAVDDFVNKVVQDFVVDLWYSAITPDTEAPKLMYFVITDVLGEIATRLKEINLVDLLTRDMVDLIGNHIELYRRNQASIGVEVMGTLSLEERDERLKHHLMASKELHPALISPDCEYKVLQRLMGGVLATVLRRRESQSPLVQCISRELLTCLVMQPIMNLASPGYINEIIELVLISIKDVLNKGAGDNATGDTSARQHSVSTPSTRNQQSNSGLAKTSSQVEASLSASDHNHSPTFDEDTGHSRPADWARGLEAATQRRTEVLTPENLENLWTKGRNYKNKIDGHDRAGSVAVSRKKNLTNHSTPPRSSGKESSASKLGSSAGAENNVLAQVAQGSDMVKRSDGFNTEEHSSTNTNQVPFFEGDHLASKMEDHSAQPIMENKAVLKRSSSTSALNMSPDIGKSTREGGMTIISEKFYSADFIGNRKELSAMSASDMVFQCEGQSNIPKVKCRVIGAYFEKTGSKSFAVYSIAVTDAENKTWFVKRRYRNFERLHRHLKDIPNYTLHLPPKRFLSSSVDDSFVHQRCIQLDQYLQDLLSIANVAEQHEVWDFLSVSSKSYSFGKSTSVMKTLAVNVDDAMDDILRQVKGVSDGLMRKVVGSPSLPYEPSSSLSGRVLSWHGDDIIKHPSNYNGIETSQSLSDMEVGDLDGSHHSHEELLSGWHSDNELNSKGFPPRVIKRDEGSSGYPGARSPPTSEHVDDPVAVPPEWTPPNVSVPLLNLVDNIFQLNRRGWLRRQVFWISKQILQLMMEDAIDDWLLLQIQWLRRDDIIAQGIRWVQDILWPNGKFFIKLDTSQFKTADTPGDQKLGQSGSSLIGSRNKSGSFEAQLEAARRASDIKKMMLDGVPAPLVSLIGQKQYKRCARDLYYFIQSNICVKQLAYGMLELVLISIFPELQDLVQDVHDKSGSQPA